MNSRETHVSEFVNAARELCLWLEGSPSDEDTERFTALVLLSKLHATALLLSDVDSNSLANLVDSDTELSERDQKVMERLRTFPTPVYWQLEGSGMDGGDKIEHSIARDLFLTYAAIRPVLEKFDSGTAQRDTAIWLWRYGFWADWGRHATNAIQVLHKHFHDKAWSDE